MCYFLRIWTSSDPFIYISRKNRDGSFTRVWQSNTVMKNLNPRWTDAVIPISVLCNGDFNRPLRIECFDWESSGSHQFIGLFDTNLALLMQGTGNPYALINPTKQVKNKPAVESGKIRVLKVTCFLKSLFIHQYYAIYFEKTVYF